MKSDQLQTLDLENAKLMFAVSNLKLARQNLQIQ